MPEVHPKVSVVMAVYNGARYLRQSIESILSQTLRDYEFIVVNDGSTDATVEILTSYQDKRLRIIHNEQNIGLPRSLNCAIAQARGQYIARQDADDLSLPGRLQLQVAYLDQHPGVGVVAAATEWIDEDGQTLRVWPRGSDSAKIQQLLIQTCPIIHGSTLYRRRCFDEVGGYDARMRTGQDYDFWLRIADGWDIICLPSTLYQYRWHREMTSVQRKEEQARNAAHARDEAIRRRLAYGSKALRFRNRTLPGNLRMMDRLQLAQRYVWWSAGARQCGRQKALHFLLVAFLLHPFTPELWHFLGGVLKRKLTIV